MTNKNSRGFRIKMSKRIHNGIKPWQYRNTPYGRYYGEYDEVYEYNRWLATKYTLWEEQEKERRRAKERARREPDGLPGMRGSCFIATAVYRNNNAQEVKSLRNFRDNVLMEGWHTKRRTH